MRNYDNACAKYFNTLKVKCLPLTTWEFRDYSLPDAVLFEKIQSNWNTKQDYLRLSLKENRELVVTDKNFKSVFATKTISKISGYPRTEILGKSPKMFQGKATSEYTQKRIKKALTELKPFKEVVLNYKKNGEAYWCEIEAYPMFDKKGSFINYVALEKIAS